MAGSLMILVALAATYVPATGANVVEAQWTDRGAKKPAQSLRRLRPFEINPFADG